MCSLIYLKLISIKIQSILIDLNERSHEILPIKWIKDLLVNYYDPMYDYQLESKKNRCILNGSKSKVKSYLNQIETNHIYNEDALNVNKFRI